MRKVLLLALLLVAISCAFPGKATGEREAAFFKAGSEKSIVKEIKPLSGSTSGNWREIWERELIEAKKEGKVVIYTGIDPQTRGPLSEDFKEKFGINAEWIVGREGNLWPFSREVNIKN